MRAPTVPRGQMPADGLGSINHHFQRNLHNLGTCVFFIVLNQRMW